MNINERTAWENFCDTGKVEDYIKYSQLKSRRSVIGSMIQEAANASENGGSDHQGADRGGERPPGDGVDS